MGSRKFIDLYTDGGFYKETGECKWAFLAVENNEEIIKFDKGDLSAGSGFEVEEAESEAIYQALLYCSTYVGNYRLHTDSRAVLDKVENKVNNATHNPRIKGIQNLVRQINNSQFPQSIVLKYHKRRANKWAQTVDDLCYRKIG